MSGIVDQTRAYTDPLPDGLYDLACLLTGDRRRAEELLSMALQSEHASTVGDEDSRSGDLHGKVVRAYLEQSHSPLSAVGWLTRRLRSQGRGPAVGALGDEAGLASLSHEERACLILRERLGLPVAEITRLTRLSPWRISRVLFSARERLRVPGTRQERARASA
jgi:hypothetical protein